MTASITTRPRFTGLDAPPPRAPWLEHSAWWVAVLVLVGATAVLRLYHQGTSYELFVDEIQYADLANSWAGGHGQKLFDQPFFLHPPLFFVLLGALVPAPVDQMTAAFVLDLRWVEVLFAAVNVTLVVAIARRVAGPGAALLAGALYALDPFIVRFDSRLMLEAPMMSMTLLGVFAAVLAMGTGPRRTTWLLLAGVAFGLAVTTKSTAALVTTVPLLLMVATGAGLPRRAAAGVIAVQCAVYGLYVSWVAGTGQLGAWFEQTLGGIVRATGVATETGFNAVGTPSFLDRVVANLSRFGPSYLLIGVAVGYVAVLLALEIRARGPVGRHAGPDREAVRRLVIYWLAGVVAAVVYTFLLGEVEEQTFYLMAVPATVVIAMLVTHTAVHRALRVFVPVALAVVLAGSGAVWWTIHTRPDDAYLRLVEYLGPQAGTGTVIALGEHTAQFVLPGFGLVELPVSGEPTPTLPPAQYALVSTELSALGLAPVPSTTVDALDRRHPLVFTASGRTVGELRLYDLSRDGRPTVAQGASR